MDIIYTYGGGEILWTAFNGIAILFKSDSPYWSNVMPLALTIGGLWGATIAIARTNIGLFAKTWFIPTYALLTLLLVPTTSVKIVDEVDQSFGADKVDNIPVGLALIASTTSSFARGLTEMLEEVFPTKDNLKYHKSGPAFAARLIEQARTVTIKDSTMRSNIKDFTRQCFWWPYIAGNVKGLREKARRTNDIIGFVESHAHPSLGIYWRDKEGKSEYMVCEVACAKVKLAMTVEGKKGLTSLISKLTGGTVKDSTVINLKPLMVDAYTQVAKHTSNASQAVAQQMLVNATREAIDDRREFHGIPRMSPELLSYSVTRAIAQQNMGNAIKGILASINLPMIQAVILVFLIILFVLVLPFCFMPGGIKTFALWIKLMLSVQLWPVFSAIINFIALMMQKKASADVLMGGEGFLVLRQQQDLLMRL